MEFFLLSSLLFLVLLLSSNSSNAEVPYSSTGGSGVLLGQRDKTTHDFVESVIDRLPVVFRCESFKNEQGLIEPINTVSDLVIPFSDLYILKRSDAFNILKNLQTTHDFSLPSDASGHGPRAVTTTNFLSPNQKLDELLAFPQTLKANKNYSLVFDSCQDFTFNVNDNDDMVFGLFSMKAKAEKFIAKIFVQDLKDKAGELAQEILRKSKYTDFISKITLDRLLDFAAPLDLLELGPVPASRFNEATKKADLNFVTHYQRIKDDPPNLNYDKLSSLTFNNNSNIPNFTNSNPLPESIRHFDDLINTFNNQIGIGLGFIDSIEKYDGARLDDDPYWSVIHGNQIQEYADLLLKEIDITNNILQEIKKDFNMNPLNTELFLKKQLEFNRIAVSGYNQTEINSLKNLGITNNQIDTSRQFFIDTKIDPFTPNDYLDSLDNLIKLNNLFKNSLKQLMTEISSIINVTITENSNIVDYSAMPIADSGGPYINRVNSPIQFDGSNSANFSKIDILKYEWDFDSDGSFDDAIGPNPIFEFKNPFNGYIGLKITDEDEAIDTNYSPIKILDTNLLPKINNFQPINSYNSMRFNETLPFFVSILDTDDEIVNIHWFIDNKLALPNSNNTFLFSPTINDIGLHTITASITDSIHIGPQAVNQSWIVTVLANDEDKDGWNSNIDCNDNNPQVNQEATEIRYNGIDDDCNPQTLDTNTPPVANNATIAVTQNGIRTIALSPTFSSDIDNDVVTFEIVKGPVNGTLGPIKVNPFNNRIVTVDYTPNPNFHGKDSFTFIAKDQFAQSNVAKMSINVGILQLPTAVDRTVTVVEDTPTQIELRGISPDGHPLTFVLEGTRSEGTKGQPAMGTITNITQTSPTTANITYIPPADFNNDISTRSDSIAFAVKDGEPVPGFEGREIDRGSMTIKFTGVNDAPQPYNNIVATKSNTPVNIELRASDADNDFFIRNPVLNNGITFSIANQPSHGILSSISSQLISIGQQPLPVNQTIDTITYTPEPGFIGQDSFSFIASDGVLQSTEGVITINVKDPNEALSKEFEDGDVIVGLAGCVFDCIEWHKADGTFVKNMHNFSTVFGSHTGGDFDQDGNLYVTTFDRLSKAGNNDAIQIFNSKGAYIGGLKDKNDFGCLDFTDPSIPHFGSPCMSPESIVFDKSGNMYVGGIATAEGDPRFPNDLRDAIRKFDPNGNLLAVYDVNIEDRGSDWIELAPDQCTMYYTSEDIHVKRYNVCTNQQLKDFSNVFGPGRSWDKVVGPPFPNYALRLLPSGDLLVASNNEIWRLDGEGNLIQKYDARGIEGWFALNLDPDGKSFWSARLGGAQSEIYRFDIETGKILQYFKTKPNIGPSGIYVKGEPKISSIEIPPTVQSMLLVTNTNNPFEVNLTGSDIANDPLNFSIVEQPKFGTLSDDIIPLSNNVSKVLYTPNPDFNGTDSFTFIANDGKLNSNNTGTIMIARNHAPVANNDGENEGINTLQGIPVNINILANDNDVDIDNPILNDTITIENIDTSETLGNVTLNSNNNTINYVPFAPEYIGQDSFNYTITDRYGLIDTAKVTVNVLSSNNIPVANNQTTETPENTTKIIQLIATDVDPQDKLFYQISSGPSNGFISNFNSTTGLAEYHPFHTFHGEDSFTFTVHDAKDKSLPGIVNITVIDDGVNDAPKVESERVSANVSQQITIDVLENDIDPNGDFMTLTNITGPFNGTAFVNQDQTITYQSDPDFNASDVLYYRVADQFGSFDIGQLIIDVQGNIDTQIIQVPSDRFVTTTRDQLLDIELEATTTIDRPVSFFIVDVPENGTLGNVTTLSNLSASVTYIPNNGFVGADSFTYIAIDDKGVISNIGSIRISIDDIPRNSPVARDGLVMLDEDTSILIQLNASDSDVNDDLTYSIESQPISGKILSFDPSTGSLAYEPNTNFNGNDGFLFKAVDQGGLESNIATVFITVNPVNDPPVANNQQLETDQNTPLQIALFGSDHIDNGTLSQFRIVNNPTNGQISNFNQTTGELTYTPNNNFFGSDSFTFKVIDSQGLESTESAIVSIDVKQVTPPPVNNPPVAVNKTIETNNNTSVRITLEGTDIDQGDTINSFIIVSSPTDGQISNFNSNTGTLTYTPNNNFVGQDSFTFKVTDNHGLQSTNAGLVIINVKSTQQPPNNEQPPLPLPSSVCIDSDNNNVEPKGTQGNDDLVGTSQRDTITGLGGNDRINGCSGDDTLNGNSGNDGIAGGPHNDNLHGNEGNDYLQGDSGSDSLYGNEGNDVLVGNEGRDRFFCGSGDDTILDFDYPLDVKSNDCE